MEADKDRYVVGANVTSLVRAMFGDMVEVSVEEVIVSDEEQFEPDETVTEAMDEDGDRFLVFDLDLLMKDATEQDTDVEATLADLVMEYVLRVLPDSQFVKAE